jgi:translation initiation factor IF-1
LIIDVGIDHLHDQIVTVIFHMNRSDISNNKMIEGLVIEVLPSALYRVEVDGPHRVTAHIGGGPERNFIRILVGDRVIVELTDRDRGRGRIVRKA